MDTIIEHLPQGKRLIEPFVGAGSVFMNTGFDSVVINDINPDLVNLYSTLKYNSAQFIAEAELLCNSCTTLERYNAIRERFNTREYSPYSMAVFFLVLNRASFNGLCRYNRDKEFNVPWGKNPKPYFPRKELEEYCMSTRSVDILCADFTKVMALSRAGDVIFADPPYQPMPGKQGFTTYSGTSFGLGDQKRLVEAALKAKARGVPTVITNSAAPLIIDLYTKAGFTIHTLKARRSISASQDSREVVSDIIAILK